MRRIGVVMLGLAGGLLALPAHADDWRDRDWWQVRVDASALDLSTPAGIDALAKRIHKGVNRICGSDRDCRDQAWASTEDQVAWAIDRDAWARRLAEERLAQLDACGGDGCAPVQPVAYAAPPPMPAGGVQVTIIYTAPTIRYER